MHCAMWIEIASPCFRWGKVATLLAMTNYWIPISMGMTEGIRRGRRCEGLEKDRFPFPWE